MLSTGLRTRQALGVRKDDQSARYLRTVTDRDLLNLKYRDPFRMAQDEPRKRDTNGTAGACLHLGARAW